MTSKAHVFREIHKCCGRLDCDEPVHVNVKGYPTGSDGVHYYCPKHGGPKRGYLTGTHRHPAWCRTYPEKIKAMSNGS